MGNKRNFMHFLIIYLYKKYMFQHCTHLTLQYVESDACMMELRFAVCNMNLPLVVVVVGTGDKWKRSEVRVQK